LENNNLLKNSILKEAFKIRTIENKFLDYFQKGLLNGTVHTCVGQEFSAIAFAGNLESGDYVFSSHRCHGHYIAFTKDINGLVGELLGKENGACGGIGSSQHLYHNKGFFSNGVQGGIIPIAAGLALSQKFLNVNNITIVFIGDGTLGSGQLYEVLNIISKWELPLLVICENNRYAQSTHMDTTISGTIRKRAEAFDINYYFGSTFKPNNLFIKAKEAIQMVRSKSIPLVFEVDTCRLNAHSKGDDNRDPKEIKRNFSNDYLQKFIDSGSDKIKNELTEIEEEIDTVFKKTLVLKELKGEKYLIKNIENSNYKFEPIKFKNTYHSKLINHFFKKELKTNKNAIFIGEDVLSPYGGAFGIAKDLSTLYPEQVFTTPISEQAITGIANGFALGGGKPYLEIMFGDFLALCFDQILNHATKFQKMYNNQIICPVTIRTPMGGYRAYGPTHSQSLEKYFFGMDQLHIVSLNRLVDPGIIYNSIKKLTVPSLVIENKSDYSRRHENIKVEFYEVRMTNEIFPTLRISPIGHKPSITIVTYGGMVEFAIEALVPIFTNLETFVEVIIPTSIFPLNINLINQSVVETKRLITLEEGPKFSGFGSEVISQLSERMNEKFSVKRISKKNVPIPSVPTIEKMVLPTTKHILSACESLL